LRHRVDGALELAADRGVAAAKPGAALAAALGEPPALVIIGLDVFGDRRRVRQLLAQARRTPRARSRRG
jgi:hypothetical protein